MHASGCDEVRLACATLLNIVRRPRCRLRRGASQITMFAAADRRCALQAKSSYGVGLEDQTQVAVTDVRNSIRETIFPCDFVKAPKRLALRIATPVNGVLRRNCSQAAADFRMRWVQLLSAITRMGQGTNFAKAALSFERIT